MNEPLEKRRVLNHQYVARNTEFAKLEKHARETKKGLWEGQTPIPPWQWRKRTR
jgi:endonuclease YncB( thermonuclease family)